MPCIQFEHVVKFLTRTSGMLYDYYSGTDMTRRPGDRTMETNGRSTASYLARTLCFPVFLLLDNKSGGKRGLKPTLSGATWDHFRCTVEPSPGHIRCRILIIRRVKMDM